MECIPIRELKNTAAISARCRQSDAPIYITKDGSNDMVIMSAEVYDRMRLSAIYEKLLEAEQDIRANRVRDARSALAELREKHGV